MIPTEKDQIEDFTPACLENIAPKPVFRFRPATARDQQRYTHLLQLEGYRLHDNEAVRQQIRDTLKQHWDADTFNSSIQRLETAWAMLDQEIPLAVEEQSAISELVGRCMDVDPMLRRMDADNRAFAENAPAVALGMFLVGWKNVDVGFRLEAGVVPWETLLRLSNELKRIETEAEKEKVEGATPGLGFLQLSLKAFQLLALTKEEEKNSPPPSPSSASPNGSKRKTTRGGGSKSGRSRQAATQES